MLTDYLHEAMRRARYELTEARKYFGSIPAIPGVWSEADNLEDSRAELQEVLEDWLVLALRRGDPIPVLGKLDLNAVAGHA
jgi:predicted RNase H-like HicB family nuclease